MRIHERTDLQQLRRRGIVREQVQSPLNDVTTGAAALVVFRLLAFAEDLDGGESSDLHAEDKYSERFAIQLFSGINEPDFLI